MTMLNCYHVWGFSGRQAALNGQQPDLKDRLSWTEASQLWVLIS